MSTPAAAAAGAGAGAAAAAVVKHRVLCLHGYRQTGDKLRVRISGFRRAFKSSVEFVCVDAPLVVPYESTASDHTKSGSTQDASFDDSHQDRRQFSWWNYNADALTGERTYSNVDDAIDFVADVCRKQGPFDGVFGFSQGGMLASFVLQRQMEAPEQSPFVFSFGIFASAPQSIDPRFVKADTKLGIPSLHIVGESDTIASPARCMQLAETFANPKVLLHPGGHYVPTSKDVKDALRELFRAIGATTNQ